MAFLSLNDYAIIGNQASTALVNRLGSIDWCCLPFIDSPSHFAAVLDEANGGRFQITPQGDFRSEQRYLQRTHILETLFETPHGRAILTDWMPMDPAHSTRPSIHRRIDMIDGKITWNLSCAPRFAYGEQTTIAEYRTLERDRGVLFRAVDAHEVALLAAEGTALEIAPNGSTATARFTLEGGQHTQFTWVWGRQSLFEGRGVSRLFPSIKESIEAWRESAHKCATTGCIFAGPWHDSITRSGLLFKLLTAPYSGAIAESITTSLPGVSGGSRTWDYRYSWIRDGALAIQALTSLGLRQEASDYFSWLSDIVIRDGAEGLQPVYTLDGGKHLPEREIPHLQGYQGSRPVRVGNQSSGQFHLDIYGHVMLAAAEHFRAFGSLPPGLWPRLSEIADYVCQAWRRPDHGPWEVRSKAEHFVASKLLCWAALDRACFLASSLPAEEQLDRRGPPHRWVEEREILHRTICSQGYDSSINSFVRAFGDRDLDSTALLIPMLGFLPFDDPRVIGTLDAIQNQLSDGVLLYRYRSADGVSGPDGPHLPSSFRFISCLALAGRIDEASDRLAELCTYMTPLGLFGEQIDLAKNETSGNFPSAGVHLAMVNAGIYVGLARGRHLPLQHVIGSEEAPGGFRPAAHSA